MFCSAEGGFAVSDSLVPVSALLLRPGGDAGGISDGATEEVQDPLLLRAGLAGRLQSWNRNTQRIQIRGTLPGHLNYLQKLGVLVFFPITGL